MGQAHGDALGLVEESLEPPEVKHPRLATEDGGDDAGVADQAAGLAGADALTGVEAGRLEAVAQLFLVDGHDDGGGGLGVQVIGGQVLENLAERQPAGVVPVGARAGLGAHLRLGGAQTAAAGRGHRFHDLAE